MKRMTKFALSIVAAIVLLPVLAFLAYDVLVFQPYQSTIQSLLERAQPEDRNPPALIRRYISASHQQGAWTTTHVARQLIIQLKHPYREGLGWQVSVILWDRLVALHLSEDTLLGLYCTLSTNGINHGLSSLSQHLFAKPLSALSESEAATVVAVLAMPSLYLREPQRLERRRDALMKRAQGEP